MARTGTDDLDRLRREVERGFRANLDAENLLPLLARLARAAPHESEEWLYAHRHLAELGVEHDPWRAALFARRVLAARPDDDGAWAVLGLSQSLLAHYRYAAHAYERALALAPDNPWYAHNLGHLYDVALNRPGDALPLLAQATSAQTGEADIAASYAHALARCGKVVLARRVLKRAIRRGATADQAALWRWLEAGAPASRSSARVGEARPASTVEGAASAAAAPHARGSVGSSRAQGAGGSSRAQDAGGSSRSQGAEGSSRAQGAGGSSRAQGAGGSSRAQGAGGSSRAQGAGSSRAQGAGGSSRAQGAGGAARTPASEAHRAPDRAVRRAPRHVAPVSTVTPRAPALADGPRGAAPASTRSTRAGAASAPASTRTGAEVMRKKAKRRRTPQSS